MSSYNTVPIRERLKVKQTQKQHLNTPAPLNNIQHVNSKLGEWQASTYRLRTISLAEAEQ